MKIYVPGYATVEVSGTNHQEVLEVASEYYSHIKNEEFAKNSSNNTDIFSESNLCTNIWKALLHLQNSPNRHKQTENELNDVVRDNLRMIYTVHDQTRQGVSESRKGAGALDMLICNSRQLPYAIIEAMKLESVDRAYIKSHITKALANYDPYGCPYVFIITYAFNNDFNSFCNRFYSYLNDFVFPFKTVTKPFELPMEFSESHHIHTILNRNGEDLSVHFLTVNLSQQLQ